MMKSCFKISALLIVLIVSVVLFPKTGSARQADISFQVFYDELSPYGQWVDYPDYGYVWIPDAGSDFVPYSSEGHWVFSEYGWTWVSDYHWGWAPFHYGRWDYDNYYGWFWVPDNEWGPSWVTWRSAEGYYGWAPMQPGMSISISFGRKYNSHNDHWIFVRDRDIEQTHINRYYVSRNVHERIVRTSTIINKTYMDNRRNTSYVSGPGRDEVQRVTGRRITTVMVRDHNKPGQKLDKGQLQIYRPQVQKSIDRNRRTAPSRVTNMKDVKRTSERKTLSQPQYTNPTENRRERPMDMKKPPSNNNTEPTQRRNAQPSNENSREQQPNRSNPPTNKSKVQPAQDQQKVQPATNKRREGQPNTVKPENNKSNDQPKENKSENRRR